MQVEIGEILEGKVTGITKFGAFVELAEGKTGMVHISEVSNSYVDDINQFLKEGDVVKVKVINISEEGKISLSIKKTQPKPERPSGSVWKNWNSFGSSMLRRLQSANRICPSVTGLTSGIRITASRSFVPLRR